MARERVAEFLPRQAGSSGSAAVIGAGASGERPPDWRKIHAFGLPGGSVRALLALLICGAIWTWLWFRPDEGAPDFLQNLMFIILGHYFASRAGKKSDPQAGPPPLYLPRGTVRWVMILGFTVVAAALVVRSRIARPGGGFEPSHATVTLVLVGGFLVGVLIGRIRAKLAARGYRPPRIVEDVRATIALVAGAALVLLVFGLSSLVGERSETVETILLKYRVQDLLAAVVGLYFGARSE